MNPQSIIDTLYQKGHELNTKNREMRDVGLALAEAERDHDKAFALAMVKLKAEGNALSACAKMAQGDNLVADLKYKLRSKEIELDYCKRTAREIDSKIMILQCDLSFKKVEYQKISSIQPT